MSDGSLCVTEAMQHELAQNWGIKYVDRTNFILVSVCVHVVVWICIPFLYCETWICCIFFFRATVLYDQPPEFFRPASLHEKHEVSNDFTTIILCKVIIHYLIIYQTITPYRNDSCFVDCQMRFATQRASKTVFLLVIFF